MQGVCGEYEGSVSGVWGESVWGVCGKYVKCVGCVGSEGAVWGV